MTTKSSTGRRLSLAAGGLLIAACSSASTMESSDDIAMGKTTHRAHAYRFANAEVGPNSHAAGFHVLLLGHPEKASAKAPFIGYRCATGATTTSCAPGERVTGMWNASEVTDRLDGRLRDWILELHLSDGATKRLAVHVAERSEGRYELRDVTQDKNWQDQKRPAVLFDFEDPVVVAGADPQKDCPIQYLGWLARRGNGKDLPDVPIPSTCDIQFVVGGELDTGRACAAKAIACPPMGRGEICTQSITLYSTEVGNSGGRPADPFVFVRECANGLACVDTCVPPLAFGAICNPNPAPGEAACATRFGTPFDNGIYPASCSGPRPAGSPAGTTTCEDWSRNGCGGEDKRLCKGGGTCVLLSDGPKAIGYCQQVVRPGDACDLRDRPETVCPAGYICRAINGFVDDPEEGRCRRK